MAAGYRGQAGLRAVEHPYGSQKARLLVRIRVAEHHFLAVAAGLQVAPVVRIGEQRLEDLAAALECVRRFEEWYDVQIGLAPNEAGGGHRGNDSTGGQLGELQHGHDVVGGAGEADHVAMTGFLAESSLDRGHGSERGQDFAR